MNRSHEISHEYILKQKLLSSQGSMATRFNNPGRMHPETMQWNVGDHFEFEIQMIELGEDIPFDENDPSLYRFLDTVVRATNIPATEDNRVHVLQLEGTGFFRGTVEMSAYMRFKLPLVDMTVMPRCAIRFRFNYKGNKGWYDDRPVGPGNIYPDFECEFVSYDNLFQQ
jgi:hypothetical protein